MLTGVQHCVWNLNTEGGLQSRYLQAIALRLTGIWEFLEFLRFLPGQNQTVRYFQLKDLLPELWRSLERFEAFWKVLGLELSCFFCKTKRKKLAKRQKVFYQIWIPFGDCNARIYCTRVPSLAELNFVFRLALYKLQPLCVGICPNTRSVHIKHRKHCVNTMSCSAL